MLLLRCVLQVASFAAGLLAFAQRLAVASWCTGRTTTYLTICFICLNSHSQTCLAKSKPQKINDQIVFLCWPAA